MGLLVNGQVGGRPRAGWARAVRAVGALRLLASILKSSVWVVAFGICVVV